MIEREVFLAAAKALRRQGFDAIDDDNRINVTVDGTHRSVDTAEFSIWLVAEHDEKEASMVRIQAAGDVVEAQRRLRAAVGADMHVAWVDVIDEAIDRIAHATDLESGDDAASRVAERVVRELRQEYVDAINRLEKQAAAREEALRAEVAALRLAADEVLSWRTADTTVLLSNPPQNAALFHAQRVLRAALDALDALDARRKEK